MKLRYIAIPLGLLVLALLVNSCSVLLMGPEPWERDLLATPAMQFQTFDDAIDDHIYFSKESSSGGRGFGGGGCGCN